MDVCPDVSYHGLEVRLKHFEAVLRLPPVVGPDDFRHRIIEIRADVVEAVKFLIILYYF